MIHAEMANRGGRGNNMARDSQEFSLACKLKLKVLGTKCSQHGDIRPRHVRHVLNSRAEEGRDFRAIS